MINVSIVYDRRLIKHVEAEAVKLPAQMEARARRDVLPMLRQSLASSPLVRYPGPVHHPIEWASEKQRIYVVVFVLKGQKYERTGELIKSWKVGMVQHGDGYFEFTLTNEAWAAQFVYGPRQQPFHRNTGWPTIEPTLAQMQPQIVGLLDVSWYRLTKSLAAQAGAAR